MKKSISNTFFVYAMAVALVAIVVFGASWTCFEYQRLEGESRRTRENLTESRKQLLVDQTELAVAKIADARRETKNRLKETVKSRVYEAYGTAMNLYQMNREKLSDEQIGELIVEALRPVRFNNGRGYYFISGMDGVNQLNDTAAELEGTSLLDWLDPEGKWVVKDIIGICREQGEGHYEYSWLKPERQGRAYPKLSYVKYFEPLDWFIGTGDYLDDVEMDIQAEVLKHVDHIKFGKDGYVFIGQYDGVSLTGPAESRGRNMIDITDSRGVKIVQELIAAAKAGGGFVEYVMPRFEGHRPLPKVSYVLPFEDWGWYVGAGIYLDDIEGQINSSQLSLRAQYISRVSVIGGLFLLTCLWGILASQWVARLLKNEFTIFGEFFDRAANLEPVTINPRSLHFKEFSRLAESANKMALERINAEKSLVDSEHKFRELADLLPQTVFEIDSIGHFTYCNRHALETFGYSVEEYAAGLNVEQMFTTQEFVRIQENLKRRLAGESFPPQEYTARRKDGSEFPALIYVSAIQQDGKPLGVRGILIDLTERKRFEEHLGHSQKMEAVGQLAGGVAHDFNNLLQAMLGYTELAMEDIGEEHEASHKLLSAQKAMQRAQNLVRQLLVFSRKEDLSLQTVDVHLILRGLMALLSRLIEEDIEVEYEPSPDRELVVADHSQLEQVLLNLCLNARDAMQGGGKLLLSHGRRTLGDDFIVEHAWASAGEWVEIRVEDNGTGIPEGIHDRIFEPFFTTKGVGKGTGLGLASAYGIVERHGGGITFESEEGKGTVFSVFLPLVTQPDEGEESTDSREMIGTNGGETILLAEDEEQVRELSSLILRRAGYRVLTAEDGEAAVELFLQHREEIDLALLDVVMPRLNGSEVLHRIRDHRPELPVLFSSGYSKDYLDEKIERNLCTAIINKPYSPGDLLVKVAQTLEECEGAGRD